jgi:hypothetical protein
MPSSYIRRVAPVIPKIATLAAALALGACTDTPAAPSGPLEVPPVGTASARWNEIARTLVVKHRPNNPAAFRLFAYLAQAQYSAATIAEGRDVRTVPGAVAGASATLLAYVFPGEAQSLDSIVRVEAAIAAAANSADASRPDVPVPFARGDTIGREAGRLIVARAQNDRFDAAFTGQIPSGPGLWVVRPPTTPLMPALGQMRPFVLATASQYRSAPPPAFGSPEFQAALAEVRQVARTRTAEQTRIAQEWALPPGTILPAGAWNKAAVDLAVQARLTDRASARILAAMHGAMMDATIAVHDAKYTYWYIRPSQADTTITLAIGLPAHPSYPSNHTAASVAAARVLGAFFAEEAARLDAMAEEAGLSRLYGGIHYRFDIDAGAVLGRAVARATLDRDGLGDLARARR